MQSEREQTVTSQLVTIESLGKGLYSICDGESGDMSMSELGDVCLGEASGMCMDESSGVCGDGLFGVCVVSGSSGCSVHSMNPSTGAEVLPKGRLLS